MKFFFYGFVIFGFFAQVILLGRTVEQFATSMGYFFIGFVLGYLTMDVFFTIADYLYDMRKT